MFLNRVTYHRCSLGQIRYQINIQEILAGSGACLYHLKSRLRRLHPKTMVVRSKAHA